MLAPLVSWPSRLTRLLAVSALVILRLQFGIPAAHAAGSTYYAAPGGSSSVCSQAAPCNLATAASLATSGADTIVLASGTYANTHVTLTASVTVRGAGAPSTILDGGGTAGSVLTVNGNTTVTLRGLTVQGGTGMPYFGIFAGGGILALGALTLDGVTVRNNHVDAGNVTGQGGGIYTPNGGLTLISSVISGNTVRGAGPNGVYGGGIEGGHNTLTNTTISNNTATATNAFGTSLGGGIDGDTNTLINSTISGNTATTAGNAWAAGGGIEGGGDILTNSVVSGNTAINTSSGPAYGGGIDGNGVILVNSVISGNSAKASGVGGGGGGISGGENTVTNSTISGNTASDSQGGMVSGGGIGAGGNTVTNSTISGNSASSAGPAGTAFGGGIEGAGNVLVNATISNNSVSSAFLPQGGGIDGDGNIMANTILAGNTTTAGTTGNCNGGANPVGGDVGGNLADDATCGFVPTSGPPASLNNATVALGPLQDNGGPLAGAPGSQVPLLTQALLPGSQAIDHGVVRFCTLALPPNTLTPPFSTFGAGDVDERGLPRHAVTRKACDSGAYDTGGTVANPLTVTGAVNALFGSGWRLGFAGSTDPAFNVAYIIFQQGTSTLVVRGPITLSCTNQCGGTADDPALGPATVTLGGTASSGRGQFVLGDTVVVTLTVLTARGTGAVVATYTVSAVAVQVFAPNSTIPLVSVSANGPFQGQSGVRFVPLHQTPAP